MKKLKTKTNAQNAHKLVKVSSAVGYRSNECRTSVIDNKGNRMSNTIENQITSSLDNMVEESNKESYPQIQVKPKTKATKKIPHETLLTMIKEGHITEEGAQAMIDSNLACGSSKTTGGKGTQVLAVLNRMNDLTEKQTRAKQLLERLNKTINSINEPEILEVCSSINKGIGKLSANWAKK